ncbi:MAG: hypothetical protein R3C52_03890 [Hyphomonadaceae bacterium]
MTTLRERLEAAGGSTADEAEVTPSHVTDARISRLEAELKRLRGQIRTTRILALIGFAVAVGLALRTLMQSFG